MPSLGSILSIATTGLRTQQEAINVTSHNIANASTEGYSRQRAVLSPMDPLRTPSGLFGTGVTLVNVEHIRDAYLDSAYRSETADFSEQDARSGILGQVETFLAEPGDGGLSSALDEFFSAWSDLSTDPSSTTARTVLRNEAEALTGRIQGLAADLSALRENTEFRLNAAVERVNDLAEQIARLNREIAADETTGETSGDLRDSRDRAIDELATLIPVQVVERENGGVGVLTSGLSLVDAAHHGTMEVRLSGGVVEIGLEGHPNNFPELGSAIGGMVELLNTDLPKVRASLDELAEALVTDLNAIHRTGTNPDGDTNIDFFDPAGVTAADISLSAAVLADLGAISAGTGGTSGEYRAGVNDVALSMASLRDSDSPTLGVGFGEHFRTLATEIGFSVRSSLDGAEVHRTLASQADKRRASYSGVSTDEELVHLIEFQTAYAAAARVVTVADEMLDSLIRM